MTQSAIAKLNLPKNSFYIELPRDFLGKSIKKGVATVYDGLTNYARFMLAVIHTMNKAYKGNAKITYEDFIERLGGSKETVSRCKQLLIDNGIIEELGKSKYKILTYYNKSYIKIGDYLHKTKFDIELEVGNVTYTVNKRLKRSTVIELSYLLQQNENPKTEGLYISSQGRLSKALNMPRTTLGEAQREFVGAGTCVCTLVTTDEYGANKKGLTKYEVVQEIRDVKLEKSKKTELAPKDTKQAKREKALREETLRVKIERHYYDLRIAAERKAEAVHERAISDKIFADIERELQDLHIQIAFAEIKDRVHADKLGARIKELEAAGDKRLSELSIDKRLFNPQYRCKECADTGYTPTGQACVCRKQLIKEMKV